MTDYTENLADFGSRERNLLIRLFTAWNEQGLPNSFWEERVRPAFNRSSGYVFLVNGNYQAAMMNGDKLELFITLPDCGEEGFISDLLEEYTPDDLSEEDRDFLRETAEEEGIELSEAWRIEE